MKKGNEPQQATLEQYVKRLERLEKRRIQLYVEKQLRTPNPEINSRRCSALTCSMVTTFSGVSGSMVTVGRSKSYSSGLTYVGNKNVCPKP